MAALVAWASPEAKAANFTWSSTAAGSDFETGSNWIGNSTPGNDLTTGTAIFATTGTGSQPQLTTSRTIGQLSFTSAAGGWTLGSNSSANVLTIGGGGISSTGTNTISANLALGAAQNWLAGSAGRLNFTGSLTGSFALSTGNSSNKGVVLLNPSGTNSINTSGNLGGSAYNLQVGGGGLTVLGGDGGTYGSRTTSSNSFVNTGSGGSLNVVTSGSLQVNSGTWFFNDLGRNSSGAFQGRVDLNGGTLIAAGARFLGGSGGIFNVNNGGVLKVTGSAGGATGSTVNSASRFAVGQVLASGQSTTMNVFSGGFVDIATVLSANSIGTLTAANTATALFNQQGGVVQIGVTAGGGSSKDLTIGGVALTAGSNAYTLSGGSLVIGGKIAGTTVSGTGLGVNNFNFIGGTLTAAQVDVTTLGSSSTATADANQVATSTNIGVLTNAGGTFAPGGNIVSQSANSYGDVTLSYAATAGKTTVTGGYTQQSNGTLAINISGTSASSVFQEAVNSGKFSNIAVTGNVLLGGNLNVSLINGTNGSTFTPASGQSFTILTGSTVSGSFANTTTNISSPVGEYKLAPTGVDDPFSSAFTVAISSSNVILKGYAQNEWIGNAGGGNWGTATLWSNGVVASGSGKGAKFSSSGTSNTAVTLDTNRTIGQIVFENGSYSITGANTLTLNNGASAATISVNGATQSIGTAMTLNSDLSVSGTTGSQLTISGAISGTRSLIKQGAGTLVLSGSNSYSGGSTLSAGTLAINNANSLGSSGSLTFSGSSTLRADASFSTTRDYVLNATATIDTNGNNLTNNGAVSGTGSLVKQGAGTLALTGSNSYSGGTTLSTGTLAINNASSLGSSGTLTFAGASTLRADASFTASRDYLLNSTATIDTNGNALTNNGVVSGTGSLTKQGAGTLALSGSNSYSGNTTLSAGTLAINNANSLGTTGTLTFSGSSTLRADATFTSARNYVLNAAATIDTNGYDLTNNGVLSGANALTKAGIGTLLLGGSNTYSGATTINAGVLEIGGSGRLGSTGTYSGAITNSATLRFSTSANQTLSGIHSGLGGVEKNGSGILALTSSNSFAGGVSLSGGVLRVGNANALGTGTLTLGGGSLSSNSTTAYTLANNVLVNGDIGLGDATNNGALTFNGTVDLGGSARTLTVNSSVTLSGTAGSGIVNGGIVKNGSGVLNISGTHAFAGGVTVNSGTLKTVFSGSTVTSSVSGGNVQASPLGTGTTTLASGVTIDSSNTGTNLLAIQALNTSGTITSVISGRQTIAVGTWDLGGGTQLNINGRSMAVVSGTVSGEGTGLSSLEFSGSLANRFTNGQLNLQTSYTGTNYGAIRFNTSNWDSTASLNIGANVLGLSNFGTSGTTSAPALSIEAAGIWNLANASASVGSLAGAGSIYPTMSVSGTGVKTLTLTGTSGSSTFSGILRDGPSGSAPLALTKNGASTQILSGSNLYSGTTTVSAGTLAISGNGTLGTSDSAVVVNGGTLDLGNLSRTNGSLTISSGTVTNGTLTASTYALNGGRVAANLGAGTINVGGNATLSGSAAATAVNINNGTLSLGAADRLNQAANVVLTSQLSLGSYSQTVGGLTGSGTISNTIGSQFSVSNGVGTSGTFNGAIRGTGSFVKAGGGKFVLAGTNSQITSTSVNEGLLTVNGRLDSVVTVNNGGSLGGSGSIGDVTIKSGGNLAPGNSPGTLTTGILSLEGGASYTLELRSDGTGTPGTDWDQVVATTLDLSALSAANPFILKLRTLDLNNDSNPLAVFDATTTHTWTSVMKFSSLNGTFNSSLFSFDTTGFQNSFIGSFSVIQNGNAIDLQYLAVPEPSAATCLLSGLGMLLVLQRGRRRSN